MGISLEQWRTVIGCFSQPIKEKLCNRGRYVLSTRYVSLSTRIALFLLLAAQGVESNPGPNTRNNRNTTGSLNNSASMAKTPGTSTNNTLTSASHRRGNINSRSEESSPIQVGRAGRNDRNQGEISHWLRNVRDNDDQNNFSQQSIGSAADTSYSLNGEEDMKKILLDIRKSVNDMSNKFDTMEQSINDLKKQNKELKEQNEQLNMKVNTMEKHYRKTL